MFLSMTKGRDTPKDTPARLSTLRVATTTRHALVLDDLAIKVVLGLDNTAKEHPAVHAGVGALEAGVVRLYSVVIVLMGVYPRCVHKSSLWAGLRGVAAPAEPFPL